ncbi:putative reverse transcriptase domain-containing protein [Tanacetum coccineum]
MLRACVIDFGGSWDAHLLLVEFFYNNSYHSSVKCAPFEALYGRKCLSLVIWAEVGESQMIGPEFMQETTDKIFQIKERLTTISDRLKSYADNRHNPLEFSIGDQVLLKVSPWKGVLRFDKKGKLAPRYKLACANRRNQDRRQLSLVEEPVEIIDREVKKLKRKISIVKVRWNSKWGPEFTWEWEDHMKTKYPNLFGEQISNNQTN